MKKKNNRESWTQLLKNKIEAIGSGSRWFIKCVHLNLSSFNMFLRQAHHVYILVFGWKFQAQKEETLLLMVVQLSLQSDGFPTLLFFPAGNKSFDPVSGIQSLNSYIFLCFACVDYMLLHTHTSHIYIYSSFFICRYDQEYLVPLCWQITVDTDRTVVALYKFLKKNASIPFKLQKPTSTPKSESSDAKESDASSTNDLKDELWGSLMRW